MLSDFFDTMGTLVGVGGQAGYLDENGNLPQVNRPLLVDSLAAVGRRRRERLVGDDLHRVGRRRGRRAAAPAGSAIVVGAAVPRRHVLLADRGDRACAGDRAGADHRRLPDDGHPHQGGEPRPSTQTSEPPGGASTSRTSPSACRPSLR